MPLVNRDPVPLSLCAKISSDIHTVKKYERNCITKISKKLHQKNIKETTSQKYQSNYITKILEHALAR